jgi:hypothetical protein
VAIQIQGNSAIIAEVDGTLWRALRCTNRPIDYGSLGYYDIAVVSGAIAAGMAANGELFHMRWTDATRLMVLFKVLCSGMRATTAFAVGAIDVKGIIARGWSADGSGGTAATMTGNNQKLRTSMGTSLIGTVRYPTTAALGAGTKTLDTQEIGMITTHSSAGVGGATPIIGSIYLPIYDLFEQDVADCEHPIVFAQNEGFVARATVPATGVWNVGFKSKWAEVAAF